MLIWDTETTGVSETDAILQIAIVDGETSEVLLDTLIRPPDYLIEWPNAEKIHQITPQMVEDAPVIYDVWPQIKSILGNDISMTYNAPFDVRLLAQSLGNDYMFDDNGNSAVLWRERNPEEHILQVDCLMDAFASNWPHREKSSRGTWRSQRLDNAHSFTRKVGPQYSYDDWGKYHSAVVDASVAAAVYRWVRDNKRN